MSIWVCGEVLIDDPEAVKPKTASLFKTMSAESIDLEVALKLEVLVQLLNQ